MVQTLTDSEERLICEAAKTNVTKVFLKTEDNPGHPMPRFVRDRLYHDVMDLRDSGLAELYEPGEAHVIGEFLLVWTGAGKRYAEALAA